MQINYPNEDVRRATALFNYVPDVENTIQDMMVPPVYAPYGTIGYWPSSISTIPLSFGSGSVGNSILQQSNASVAPNSAAGTTVATAAAATGLADAPPAANVSQASATGAPMGPVSLVAPMPSITQSPSAPTPPVIACNPTDACINSNPMLAAAGILVAYLLFRGGR